MNEAETRAEYIDPKLKDAGWGVIEGTKIYREYRFTDGRIQAGGIRSTPDIADYVLEYKNQKLAIIEAKSEGASETEGLGQAKDYSTKLQIPYAYSTNGKSIYEVNMQDGQEGGVDAFPSPDELWNRVNADWNEWKNYFSEVPFEDMSGTKPPRYYQELAVNNALDAIAEEKNRILLTLATGTGKTYIAFQIAWKLFHSRWNLNRDGNRRPRILFLADRNILADQAFNSFSAFPEDALVRIKPLDIRKKGKVPKNGAILFTIFQTFMSGENDTPFYGDYPPDFFDLIIIDECHRGGANDESNWRGIMDYFSPAVQIGLTATPKRKDNVDTYSYFGEPVYIYSLKQGVNDGFLTPFKVKRIQTTLDDYMFTSDDQLIEGEVEEGKLYVEEDFNRIIVIEERESKRVDLLLENIKQNEKTIVFCSTQEHALAIRNLINQKSESADPHYCVRVTANDGALGEEYLRKFQDNEKTIPTILTTSQKLSTGVDARNVRNIALLRPVNSIIEFKQIVGRGTRLFDGKEYFTILDFVNAYQHFSDPEWDGEPIDETSTGDKSVDVNVEPRDDKPRVITDPAEPVERKKKIKIKLADGKEREIQHMIQTSFWSPDGKPISSQQFLENMFGILPDYFKDEDELREIWSNPKTRKALLNSLAEEGYDMSVLESLQNIIEADESDLFDVLSYVSFAIKPITRKERAAGAKEYIFKDLSDKETEFLMFVLDKYIDSGVDELDEEKLPTLLNLKYKAIADAEKILGGVENIRDKFLGFQKNLYTAI